MSRIFMYLVIFATTGVSFVQPWIGVVAYYLLAILFPQTIWSYSFGDLRVSLYVAVATVIGFMVAMLSGHLRFQSLMTRQNLFLALLWICFLISFYFNPYGNHRTSMFAVNSRFLFAQMNKIFLFYFIAVLLIDTETKLYYLYLVLLTTVIFFTIWANNYYLSGAMDSYRLAGPGGGAGIYGDENCFAMVLVVGTAFLMSFCMYCQHKGLRLIIMGIIPFAWHAIFLTGSRGGLVGLGVVSVIAGIQSKRRGVLVLLMLALTSAFLWQGGSYLLGRTSTIVDFEDDGSAMGRVDAWKAGFKMIADHPITGVGPGNFMVAFSEYSDKSVHVSHNTAMQFGAESGVLSAILYLGIFYNVFRQGRFERSLRDSPGFSPRLKVIHQATEGGLIGFFVCALFLNLATYDVFYYLFLLHAAWRRVALTATAI